MKPSYKPHNIGVDDTINIRAEIEKYLLYWKWFAVGIILALIAAYSYLRYTTPQYNASAIILIKDDKKSGASAELAAFEDLGILGSSGQNIDNEIEIIKSRKIIGNVIKNLDLNISYFSKGRIKETDIYGKTPLKLVFSKKNKNEDFYKLDTVFSILKKNDNEFDLISESGNRISSHFFGKEINSSIGTFKITHSNLKDKNESNNSTIKIVIQPLNKLIDKYKKNVNVSPVNKKSSVVSLSINDAVRKKAEQFLDSLVSSYNRDAIIDKSLVSQKTKTFIDDRLKLVKKDFDDVNLELKNFKTTNEVTNIEAESELILKSIDDVRNKIIDVNIQLALVSSLYDELINNSKDNNLLPPNLGLENVSIASSILQYNKLIQKRVRLLRTAGKSNPTVINVTNEIIGLKSSLTKSLENSRKGLDLTLKELISEDNKIKAKISGIPIQELELGKIKLKQEITSGLYSYLLKKKEETDISLAVTVANAKIIDTAYSSELPVSPRRSVILLAALLLGGVIPFIIIYIINLFDTKIHNKADIEENLSIPFLGDVPKSESKEKIVIGSDARSSTAEAFRLIRTNLDFMLTNIKGKNKTIFVTSTTSGEGKSFISINVAASLALSGKKVLLMGMDLRAPKVTEYLGIPDRKGVTNYITDDDLDLENLIFNIDDVKNLDIISSGVVPPNPAELLMTKRTENLFNIIKEEYDYVVVDTAPVNLVTDTLLISKYADMFIYIARANYLDKRLLAVPQTLYNEKRLPNMAMVLNDTDPKRSYGYGYGGYGYGYVVEDKPWYKKIFTR
jgi:capsular exopolysaccharide synthesis family protein